MGHGSFRDLRRVNTDPACTDTHTHTHANAWGREGATSPRGSAVGTGPPGRAQGLPVSGWLRTGLLETWQVPPLALWAALTLGQRRLPHQAREAGTQGPGFFRGPPNVS